MAEQRLRLGVPNIPPNTIVGNGDSGSGRSEPPYALTPKELGEILNSGSMVTETASFTFLPATHNAQTVRVNSASNINLTLPATAPVGSLVTVLQVGAGKIQFLAGSGATVNSAGGLTLTSGQWTMATAFVESNTNGTSASWVLTGSLQ